jgi:hypothetical protein
MQVYDSKDGKIYWNLRSFALNQGWKDHALMKAMHNAYLDFLNQVSNGRQGQFASNFLTLWPSNFLRSYAKGWMHMNFKTRMDDDTLQLDSKRLGKAKLVFLFFCFFVF